MSAQGTTLRRGTVYVPMWPLAVLLVSAVAIVIAISLFDTRPATHPVASATLVERLANSGAIPAASTEEVTTFPRMTLVERFANSGAIPAASTEEVTPVTLEERFANSGAIPTASLEEAIASGRMSLVERLANSGAVPAASTDRG